MSKEKKRPSEMTTDELAKKLFPKKLREELDKVAHEKEAKKPNSDSPQT